MNTNKCFIEKLRCPDYFVKNSYASLNCPPKYSQTFIMNQMINKPRILRNQYTKPKVSTSVDNLIQETQQPQYLSLTISQFRDLKNTTTPLKIKSNMKKKKTEQVNEEYKEEECKVRERSKTFQYNTLAKSALLYVSKLQNRNNKQIQNQVKLSESFDSSNKQLTQPIERCTTTMSQQIGQYNTTLNSIYSQQHYSIDSQIECVKQFVSQTNNYNIKWDSENKILTKNIPKKLYEKYIISDDSSYYLESSRFKIEENFNQVYKNGKYRWLYPGEEAAILEGIEQFLTQCEKKITQMFIGIQKILKQIILQKRLEYLTSYPICLKQIEAHWKIMATCFKLNMKNKINKSLVNEKLWQEIQGSKTLFLDLNQERNLLVQYVNQL